MFIFRGNSRTFRCSAVLLKGSKTGFVCKLSYFFGASTSSIFIFRGNSRTFRCSPMLLTGVFTIKLGLFWRFWRCNIRPKNWSRVCVVILVLFGVLPHPAQELMFIFRASFRTFRCSCSHRVLTYRVPKHRAHTCCSHIEVFLCWCGGVFVVVFLCFCRGVFVVEWSHIECSHRVVTHRVLT